MTTISGTHTQVVLNTQTYASPIIITGVISDPNTNDTALLGDVSPTIWTIVNQGTIQETGNTPSTAIKLFSAGTITNTGLIKANGAGIVMPGGLVANSSTIIGGAGDVAVYLTASGTVTNAAGGLLQGGNGAVFIGGTAATVANLGTIVVNGAGGLPAIRFGNSNPVVTNGASGSTAALIKGPGGIGASGTGTVVNFGQIVSTNPVFSANYAYGINITGAASLVTNNAGATISAINNTAVKLSGGGGTVNNFGTITASLTLGVGVDMLNGGRVINGSGSSPGALIQGGEYGVSRATTVVNYGTITGTAVAGISTGQAATVTNGNGSTTNSLIEGKAGVKIFGSAGILTNFGTVLGTGDIGASFSGNAAVTNGQAGSTAGLIEGTYGINIGKSGTIVNFGTIIGTAGRAVFAGNGGTLANGDAANTGRQIIGTSEGVHFFLYGPGTITNFGTIKATATSGSGALVRNGGTIQNGVAGSTNWLISGGALGVHGGAGNPFNLTNYGTISGANQAGVEYGATGTITNAQGAVIAGASGLKESGANLVINAGAITGSAGNGVGVGLTGTVAMVNNSGLIQGGYRGIQFDHSGTVNNTGTIAAGSERGILLSGGGLVNNAAGKSISGGSSGVEFFIYVVGTLNNAGLIQATATNGVGAALRHGGDAVNASTGLVQGGQDGLNGATNLTNYGTIIGGSRSGVEYGSGGTIINAQNALISGGSNGIFNKAVSVANAGTIIGGTGFGIHLYGTAGLVSNTGSIQGGYRGVQFDTAGTVVNNGVITASAQHGIFIESGGVVTNASGKSIVGGSYGINFFIYGAGLVTNAGTIKATATNGVGIGLRSGGTVTNNAGGLIQGNSGGVYLFGSAAQLVNFGTIIGNTAIYAGGTNDRVILESGAVVSGKLTAAGNHGNTLEIAGSIAGTLPISGFSTLQFDSGGSATVKGSSAQLPTALTGFAGGDIIDLTGFAAVSKTFTGSGLVLTDASSNHQTVGIQGNYATSDFAIASDGAGGTLIGKAPAQSPAVLNNFGWQQGWGSPDNPRFTADVNGDGTTDYLGFGFSAVFIAYGGTFGASGQLGPGFSSAIAAVQDFGSFEGYTAVVQRGAAATGVGSGDSLYGQGFAGIYWYAATGTTTITDGTSNTITVPQFQNSPNLYGNFGSQQGWSPDNGFQILKSTTTDAFASILGFGNGGIVVGPQAFAPGATAAGSYVLDFQGGNSSTTNAGNNFGWRQSVDVRTFTDVTGKMIDLNKDGIADFVGMGPQGLEFAFGNNNGPNGSYQLGALEMAQINGAASDLGEAQGWTNSSTLRFVVADPQTGFDDILAFGNAGVLVAPGQDPATHNGQPFGQLYLAMPDFGANQGWSMSQTPRIVGDANGDGIPDIVGFGANATFAALGSRDAAGNLHFTLAPTDTIGDFGFNEGWSGSNPQTVRALADFTTGGSTHSNLVLSGAFNTQVWHFV